MSEETNNNVAKTYTDPDTGKFVSGNPGGGRPPGSGISITTEIKKRLAEVPPGQKASYLKLLIDRIMKQAIQDGDTQMIKKIWEYIDGMPKQPIDLQGSVDVGISILGGDSVHPNQRHDEAPPAQ